MALKNITLTGAEIAVTGLDGSNAAIRNDGADTIYAAKQPGITPGADGVLSIPAGGSAVLYGISGEIFMLGTGAATIISSDYNDNPFKSAAQGGSGADDVARAAINGHAGNTEIHVTADEKKSWNGKTTIAEATQVFSNPNLLINPDFRINQRGLTEYETGGFALDRWYAGGGEKITVNSDGITVECVDSTARNFYQKVNIPEYMVGTPLTFSAKILEMSGRVRTTVQHGEAYLQFDFSKTGVYKHTFTPTTSEIIIQPAVPADVGAYVKVQWAKLEIGSIATAFVPPDPATELIKCQRYYQIHSTGDIAAVDLRPVMCSTPTVTQLADGNYAYAAEL